jgi:hypothetical protein
MPVKKTKNYRRISMNKTPWIDDFEAWLRIEVRELADRCREYPNIQNLNLFTEAANIRDVFVGFKNGTVGVGVLEKIKDLR